jgi:two-component system, OmpR family, response regulator
MKALVVEDDHALAVQLDSALKDAGFVVDTANDGTHGEFLGSTESYDIALVDLGLPGLDGVEMIRRWRSQGIAMPVLVLTARGEWSDKVSGFKAGADDYLTKPFHMAEVILRAHTLIRRSAGHAQPVIQVGDLLLDTTTGLFTIEGIPLKLTSFENRLLRYLTLHHNRAVNRTELSEHMYDHGTDRDFKSLEVIIGRLRKKIGNWRIETLRGEGYRLLTAEPDS